MPYKLNIPQNLVEFKDGGLTFRNNYDTVKTKSILILGKSIDGPLEPVAVSIDTVDKIYGKDVDASGIPNGGTITTAVNDAYRAGCRDIRAMKISGSAAKATISGPSKNVSILEKKEEVLGFVGGNESTKLVLNNTGVIQESIIVYVDDRPLSCTLAFDSATSAVTIPAGVCKAKANAYVKYQYNAVIEDVRFEETLIVSAEKTVTVEKTPKEESVVVTLNDIVVPSIEYTITGKVISFVKEEASSKKKNRTFSISENDIVEVEYLASDSVVKNATDTGKDGVPYITATTIQILTLPEVPEKNTTILYCDGKEVSKKHYAVAGTSINVKKEFLVYGAELVATYIINTSLDQSSSINFESFFASSIYNSGSITVSEIMNSENIAVGKQILIEKPREKQAIGEKPLTYSSLSYPTFGAIVNAINQDLRGGVYKATTDFSEELTSTLSVGRFEFSGGDSGINATTLELKEALSGERDEDGYLINEGVYQLLEGYNVDYIVLTGVYADDVVPEREGFAYDLAMHCAMSSHKNKTIYSAIAVKPCRNTSLRGVKEYVDNLSKWNQDGKEFLLKEDGKVIEDSNGKPVDLGMYVRVVGGTEPLFLNDDLGKHAANPAVVYIALQTTLNAQSSPLNKMIQNSKGVRVRLTEAQLTALTRANIVTFSQKQTASGNLRDEAFVFDSMTQALPGSDYVRTTACEAVRLIADDVRDVADPFIGEPPVVESKNSFAAALSKRFSQRKQEGAIHDIGFEIIETPQMALIGDCSVVIDLITTGERRRINTSIGLKPAL